MPDSITIDIDPAKTADYHGSATSLPFEDSTFDSVTALEILEHLDWDDQMKAMSEMKRVLKPGGLLIVSVPNSSSFMVVPQRLVWWIRERTTQRNYHWNGHTHAHIGLIAPQELVSMLKWVGFRIVSARRLMLYDFMVVCIS